MSVVLSAPPFRWSKTVTGHDTVDQVVGSVGFHNSSGTGGYILVTYLRDTPDETTDTDAELFIAAGDFVLVSARRLHLAATVVGATALALTNVQVLYP